MNDDRNRNEPQREIGRRTERRGWEGRGEQRRQHKSDKGVKKRGENNDEEMTKQSRNQGRGGVGEGAGIECSSREENEKKKGELKGVCEVCGGSENRKGGHLCRLMK